MSNYNFGAHSASGSGSGSGSSATSHSGFVFSLPTLFADARRFEEQYDDNPVATAGSFAGNACALQLLNRDCWFGTSTVPVRSASI